MSAVHPDDPLEGWPADPVHEAVALADAAYACTHKWLLGPVGNAVVALTPDLLAPDGAAGVRHAQC